MLNSGELEIITAKNTFSTKRGAVLKHSRKRPLMNVHRSQSNDTKLV